MNHPHPKHLREICFHALYIVALTLHMTSKVKPGIKKLSCYLHTSGEHIKYVLPVSSEIRSKNNLGFSLALTICES